MVRLGEVLRFKKELFFEGAVQLDWFYEQRRRVAAARSFVFHGPEYFGVSQDDVQSGSHDLVDTCTFTQMLAQRLYADGEENPLIMAVAGYGSGKSHLGLTLATLFSTPPGNDVSQQILKNISDADKAAGQALSETIDRPNLVIALNGMKDFNLTYEILNAARKALRQHNVDESPLREITRAYEVARIFLKRNFGLYTAEFERAATEVGIDLQGATLATYLESNLDSETSIFEAINKVYQHATGVTIRWDDGISAGDILGKLQDAFCGDRGHFNKILILFDEFGRFIEYASESPARAGQSAIQQVFEAIQNAGRNIVFVGFIQSDLKTYLARVEKSSNIVRYVGRFEASDKVYLSSNLETIFANLIERKDQTTFQTYVRDNSIRAATNWSQLHSDLINWLPTATGRSLWRDWAKFSKVVLEGTYPLHPVTTWMLANLSSWLQQRSALTFVNNEFELLSKNELQDFTEPPVIHPIRLIQSDFFTELLRAEEEGRQQSEYCILYNQVLRKHRDKCTEAQLDVLAANLILRIGRFKTGKRHEAVRAISYCLPHATKTIEAALQELENELGVLSFDEAAGCFDFVEDATGARDFRRFIARVRSRTAVLPSLAFQSAELRKQLGLDTSAVTSFGHRKSIRTQEWQFSQDVVHAPDLDARAIRSFRNDWLGSTSPEKAKGRLTWVYLSPDDDDRSLQALQEQIRSNGLDQSPLLFFALHDGEGKLLEAIRDLMLLRTLSDEDRGRYARFIPDFEMKATRAVEDTFKELAGKRLLITGTSVEAIRGRISEFCDRRLEQVYPKVISFPFEGFHNKNIAPAKKLLAQIAKNLLTGKMDYQSVQAQNRDFKNRVDAVLVADRHASWGVLTNEIQLIYPQDANVRALYSELDQELEETDNLEIKSVFAKYLAPPYGLNEFSLGLLLACYITFKGQGVKVRIDQDVVRTLDWAERTYLEKGIDFRVLENSRLIRVDVDEYMARYVRLCDLVEATTDISEAYGLISEFYALKQEQEVPPELEWRVKYCENQLAECRHLFPSVIRELETQHEKLARATEYADVRQLLSVINACEGKIGLISGSTKYKYSPEHRAEFDKLAAIARNCVEEKFDSWLASLRCESVAAIDSFESSTKSLVKRFGDLGYREFGRKVQSKMDSVLADMRHIRMLQTIREQIEAFLRECNPSTKATFDQLAGWNSKGQELEEFILTHRSLTEIEIKDYQAKIRRKLDTVEQEFEKFYEQISDAYDTGFGLETVDDCHTLLSKISNVLSRNIKDKDRDSLVAMSKEAQQFIMELAPLHSQDMGRYTLQEAMNEIRATWESRESELDFGPVLDNYWQQRKLQLDRLDAQWTERYLTNPSSMIGTWDVNQCFRWQSDTNLLPNYLRNESVEQYREVRDRVTGRLSGLRVEAVLTMFGNLTPAQKSECFDKLKLEMQAAFISAV